MIRITDPIYRFTSHLRQRYYERVLNLEWRGFSKHDNDLKRLFSTSIEQKSWVNDQNMVEYFKKKYGNCKVKLFKHTETGLYFVCKRDESITNLFMIVTCFYGNPLNTMYK